MIACLQAHGQLVSCETQAALSLQAHARQDTLDRCMLFRTIDIGIHVQAQKLQLLQGLPIAAPGGQSAAQ